MNYKDFIHIIVAIRIAGMSSNQDPVTITQDALIDAARSAKKLKDLGWGLEEKNND